MNREDIIRMAEECGIPEFENNESQAENIMRFAALVAKHTLANIDPSKFMSHQESYEAGAFAEREACAKVCEDSVEYAGDTLAEAIRARGSHD